MKIPQLHFVHFPGYDGGTWWLTDDSEKRRKFKGNSIRRLCRSPVTTVELLSILYTMGR
jgi:hypothetical protein